MNVCDRCQGVFSLVALPMWQDSFRLIEACEDLVTIKEQINNMLANSPEEDVEEYSIHDHEGFEGYP